MDQVIKLLSSMQSINPILALAISLAQQKDQPKYKPENMPKVLEQLRTQRAPLLDEYGQQHIEGGIVLNPHQKQMNDYASDMLQQTPLRQVQNNYSGPTRGFSYEKNKGFNGFNIEQKESRRI